MLEGNSNIYFEKGNDPSVLLIAFTGYAHKLMMQPFEFFQLSGLYPYNRLLIRDPSQLLCLGGIDGEYNSFKKLLEGIEQEINNVKPDKIIVVGTSGGGFTALLTGHIFCADYVHAFSPQTYINFKNILKYMDWHFIYNYWHNLIKVYWIARSAINFFDLKKVLREGNGKSHYYIHICKHHKWDRIRARHLDDCPQVNIIEHPCNNHHVARYLAKERILRDLFEIEKQDYIEK